MTRARTPRAVWLPALLAGALALLSALVPLGGGPAARAASATAPTITITVPVSNAPTCACLRGPVTLLASPAASTGRTIASVEWQYRPEGAADWTTAGTAVAAPWSTDLDTSALNPGSYDLRAVATDSAGESQVSDVARDRVVANNATFVALGATGSLLTGTVKLTVKPEAGGAFPSTVTFERSPAGTETWTTIASVPPDTNANGDPTGSFSFSDDTKQVADGVYDLRVSATDDSGDLFVARPVRDLRVDNTPPQAALTVPDGKLSGLVSLKADVRDEGAGVASVRFERSAAGASTWTRLRTVTAAPWETSLDTRLLDDGLYDLRVVATDRAGLVTRSPVARAEVNNPERPRFDQLSITNTVAPAHGISLLGAIAGSAQHETWAYGFTNAPPASVDARRLPYTALATEQLVLLRYTDEGGWQIADVLRNPDGSAFAQVPGDLTISGGMTSTGEAWLAVVPRSGQSGSIFHRLPGGRFELDPASTSAMASLLTSGNSLGTTSLRIGESAGGQAHGMVVAPQQAAASVRVPSGSTTVSLFTRLDYGLLSSGAWTKHSASIPPTYVPRASDLVTLRVGVATGASTGWAALQTGGASPFVLGRFDADRWSYVAAGLDALDLTEGFTARGPVVATDLFAGSGGVWSSAAVRDGTVVSRLDAQTGGALTGSWCTPPVILRSLGCSQVLDPNRPAAVPSSVFDTSQGEVGVALQRNVLGIYALGEFTSVPAPGFNGGPGKALFTAPDEGWVAGDFALGRVSAQPPQDLLTTWPQANRSPLLAAALPRGASASVAASGALAVGLDGTAVHYDAAAGWLLDATPARARRLALRSVAFSGPDTAFAVGQLGLILRWDGKAWSEDPQSVSLVQSQLDSVAFDANGQGWAVGADGTILHFDGNAWSVEEPPAEDETVEITSVTIAGSEVVAVAGGNLIERGSDGGWQRVPDSLLPDPAPQPGTLRLVSGLPDGGLIVAGRNVMMTRDAAGEPFVYSAQPIEGTAVALAATRDGGALRAFVSLAPIRAGTEAAGESAAFPPADGELMRQTADGWLDLSRAQYASADTPTDGAVKSDPVLAVVTDGTGAWAVGGYAGTVSVSGLGTPTNLAARPFGWRTASIFRYDRGGSTPSPAVGQARATIPARPHVVSFAFFSSPACRSQCASVRDAQPDVNLKAAAGQVADYAKQPGGPAFAVLGGNARGPIDGSSYAAGNGAADFARLPDLLGPITQAHLPLFAAFGPRDSVPGLDEPAGPWAGAFAAAPPPFGSGQAAAGITSAGAGEPTGAVHRYYAFTAAQNGGEVRVIVLDNSRGSLDETARGQTDWLDGQLADAQAASLPIVVFVAQPLRAAVAGGPSDAEDVAGKLATAQVLAVFSTAGSDLRNQTNQQTLVPAKPLDGAARIPEYEGATLGYQQPQNNGVVWYFASVDTATRVVDVQAVPLIESLAVRPLRGLEVARSSTLSFDALGRRPLGSLATRPGDDRFPGFDSYVSIPASAGSNIPPTYSFSSSDPTIGDFVIPSGAGSTYPKLNVSGKPTPSFLSGLFCAFNAGTTTVTVTSGLLSSSVPVTVRPGDIGRPCGTVFRQGVGKVVFVPSTKQVRQASAPVGTSTPPPAASPAPVTAEAALPLVALPPPPAAPAAKPPAKPAPQPAPPLSLFGGLLAAAPQLASNAAVSPPPPPPTFFANPIPPGGATVRVQEEKREEEAAPESSAAFSRYSSDDHLPIQPFIFGVMLIAALAGVAIRLPRRRGPAYSMSRVRYPDRRDARPRRRYP